jgi:hypothetical protein
VAGLAILPILALAALGLQTVAASLRRVVPGTGRFEAGVRTMAILVMVCGALWSSRVYGRRWISNVAVAGEVADVVSALRTESLAWVNPPYGEQYFVESAVGSGLKLSYGFQTWSWAGRSDPEPEREAVRGALPPGARLVAKVGDIRIVSREGRSYATLARPDGRAVACAARGIGGDLDVFCADSGGGVLELKENAWTGWKVFVDGRRRELLPGRWLSVVLSPGSRAVSFRYRPWDTWVGLLLGAVGWVLAFRGLTSARVSAPAAQR